MIRPRSVSLKRLVPAAVAIGAMLALSGCYAYPYGYAGYGYGYAYRPAPYYAYPYRPYY